MKVKCIKVISQTTGEDLGEENGYSRGKEYVVLALRIRPKWGISICLLEDEDNSPFYCNLTGFEVISQSFPDNWLSRIDESGITEIMPQSWCNDPDFLEKVEDGVQDAVDLFYEEAAATYRHEGLAVPWLKE